MNNKKNHEHMQLEFWLIQWINQRWSPNSLITMDFHFSIAIYRSLVTVIIFVIHSMQCSCRWNTPTICLHKIHTKKCNLMQAIYCPSSLWYMCMLCLYIYIYIYIYGSWIRALLNMTYTNMWPRWLPLTLAIHQDIFELNIILQNLNVVEIHSHGK